MPAEVVGAAESDDGRYVTAHAHGRVPVWSAPGRLESDFAAPLAAHDPPAIPGRLIAFVRPAGADPQIVVGAWLGGVAGHALDGAVLWHRKDLRHVEPVAALPVGDGRVLAGVVTARGPGLVLGPTGGTRHTIRGARFLAGGPDGAVVTQERETVALRPAADRPPAWRVELGTFALLDAVVGEQTLLCGADGRLRLVGADGAERWRTSARATGRITRIRICREDAGWLCLTQGGRVQHADAEGVLRPVGAVPWDTIGFVGPEHVIGPDGALTRVRGAD
ncbi:hypothetical protein [Dactylosporangium darangshiense]|uniref:Uncharacterized protein n=1 Tax=Dactylosporangium darangshiense TaxID=579108 RepID=A0ABP8DC35_9ACTN